MKNLMFLNKLFQSNIDKGIIKFASRFSLFSLILGTFALTISLSLLEGFDETIHSLAYKFDSRYHISTYNNSNFQLNDKIIKIINNNDETAIIYPIIERYTILKSSNGLKPIYIKAVTNNYVKNKFNINFQSNNSIIISDYLKKELLNKNNELALLNFPDENNYFNYSIHKFVVTNTFNTGFSDYDKNIAFIPLSSAKKIFYNDSDIITSIAIDTKKEYSKAYQNKFEYLLGFPFLVKSTEDIHQEKFVWIEVQKQPIPIVLGLITLVSSFVIISTLLILIVKKFKSIGILRAMGMNKNDILLFFTSYGIKLGLKGTIIGSGSAIILLLVQQYFGIIKLPSDIYFLSTLPVKIIPLNIILILLVSISLTLFATLIPAYISIKLDPINAIKVK